MCYNLLFHLQLLLKNKTEPQNPQDKTHTHNNNNNIKITTTSILVTLLPKSACYQAEDTAFPVAGLDRQVLFVVPCLAHHNPHPWLLQQSEPFHNQQRFPQLGLW